VPVAVVFLLRAVVLVLLWGFVVAAIVAVRHDVFSERAPRAVKPAVTPPQAPPPTPAAPVAATPAAPAGKRTRKRRPAPTRVVVVDGPSAGATVALSSLPVTIGRADDSTIVLADDYVSNHHARLVPRADEWLVEDSGSTNGTFVGAAKITAPVVVPVGGRIRIGRNVLELQA
jgi:pSer/pThr/pTyr-binding forkhead associated (FHA) protein